MYISILYLTLVFEISCEFINIQMKYCLQDYLFKFNIIFSQTELFILLYNSNVTY